jgi:hypothetical protein
VAEAVPNGVEDRAHHGICGGRQAVVHPETFLLRRDQARAAQIRQVPRGPGLWDLERLVDVADAHLSAEEQA